MKFVDVAKCFDGDHSNIALLSTFQFDPDYFERRLLRCPTLTKARRIAVFVDARHWFDLLRQDVPARWLNRRYLVVPVYRANGVFHPKLNLLLAEQRGQIHCGSNNLTRSGCSSNLELLNVVPFEMTNDYTEELALAKDVFGFFKQAAWDTDGEVGRIVREWLQETEATFPWLMEEIGNGNRQMRLLHTYDGPIWGPLVEVVGKYLPSSAFVISPFHDAECELIQRVKKQWPRCQIELLVQQGYTNLSPTPLKKLRSSVTLSELCNTSRRLHAKLFAWEGPNGSGYLVGSANFTTAAFDGRNVEACLLLSEQEGTVTSLFDKELAKRHIDLTDFEPGFGDQPEQEVSELPRLRITSAVIVGPEQIRVQYAQHLETKPTALRLTIRTPNESRPRASVKVPNRESATETVPLPENALADAHGTLIAALVAEMDDGNRIESVPVWVIQEDRLTYEPADKPSSQRSNIEESGEGLAEYLDEIGERDGVAAVIEYLRRLNIRFHDGSNGVRGAKRLRLRRTDPFHADTAPDWLINAKDESSDLKDAIYEFVERHEKRKLRKHARRGNINGMENFLDVFTTMIRILYRYYRRNVVERGKLIGRLCDFIELASCGTEEEYGYLYAVSRNLGGDYELLQEVCDETGFPAELRAALLIVQKVRFVPDEPVRYGSPPKRPKDVLQPWSKKIGESLEEVGVEEPPNPDVRKALEKYRMFSKGEVEELLREL